MTIEVWELAGADDATRFSPHCWRVRLALAHKGLDDVRFHPWRFTEKEAIAFSGQDKTPVLKDGERVVRDSWAIAEYLEETYPDRPLFGSAEAWAMGRFVKDWCESKFQPMLLPALAKPIHDVLAEKDRAYFRESREERLGRKLEDLHADRDHVMESVRARLEPLKRTLAVQTYLGGFQPNFADYILLAVFQWARFTDPALEIDPDPSIVVWRQRVREVYERNVTGLAAYAL